MGVLVSHIQKGKSHKLNFKLNLIGELMKNLKAAVIATFVTFAAVAGGNAHAALDAAQVTAIQTEVLGDVTTAVGAGFAVLAVVLASSIGFSLLGRFISKGANGG